jgi:Flp pilus assembly protein TadD
MNAYAASGIQASEVSSLAQKKFKSGTLSAMFEDYQTSIKEFRAAIAAEPNFAEAHYGLAAALAKSGHEDEAIRTLREALALDGELKKLALIDIDFKELRAAHKLSFLSGR